VHSCWSIIGIQKLLYVLVKNGGNANLQTSIKEFLEVVDTPQAEQTIIDAVLAFAAKNNIKIAQQLVGLVEAEAKTSMDGDLSSNAFLVRALRLADDLHTLARNTRTALPVTALLTQSARANLPMSAQRSSAMLGILGPDPSAMMAQ
jgi:hypothetical protein